MPIKKIEASILKQQQHNADVQKNIAQITDLSHQYSSKELIQQLQNWQDSPHLKVNNTQFWSLISIAVVIAISVFLLHLVAYFFLVPLALAIFAYRTKESNQARDQLISSLRNNHLEEKYSIDFGYVLADYDLAELQHLFPLFNLGNYSNDIKDTATGTFQIFGKQYPFMLYRYHYVDRSSERDKDGHVSYKYHHYDLWGIFINHMPFQGLSLSTKQKRACRLGVKWSTSDIKFNKNYQLSGNNEMALARFFNPTRILILEKMMQDFKGDFYIHPQTPLLCWQFGKDIFDFDPNMKDIDNVQQLAESLQQLKMLEFENLQRHLTLLLEKLD